MKISEKIIYLQVCEDVLEYINSSTGFYEREVADYSENNGGELDAYHRDMAAKVAAFKTIYKEIEKLALSK